MRNIKQLFAKKLIVHDIDCITFQTFTANRDTIAEDSFFQNGRKLDDVDRFNLITNYGSYKNRFIKRNDTLFIF